jgi:hypothetical protein
MSWEREQILLKRIRWLTWLFIAGLVFSGLTAITLVSEANLFVKWFGLEGQTSATASTDAIRWLLRVRETLLQSQTGSPFLFYGTDWLAFGHFVIALSFVGALRNPVRNRWLYSFGMIACVLVIPFAFIFGGIRGIPVWWRLIDCSFGVLGFIPLWLCNRWSGELESGQETLPHAMDATDAKND